MSLIKKMITSAAAVLVAGSTVVGGAGVYGYVTNLPDTDIITPDLGNDYNNPGTPDGPETGDAQNPETSLDSNVSIPDLLPDLSEPVPEGPSSDQSEEVDKPTNSTQNNINNQTLIAGLKTDINSKLKSYFNQTNTIQSAQFEVSEIVYLKSDLNGIKLGFTTIDGKGQLGFTIASLGNATHKNNVETVTGASINGINLLTLEASSANKLVTICKDALTNTKVSFDNYYIAPLAISTNNMGDKVIAYYKSLALGSENMKKLSDGTYEYMIKLLSINANGVTEQKVNFSSNSRLSKNQFIQNVNDTLENKYNNTTNEDEPELEL